MLHSTSLERLAKDKQSSLLGSIVSCKENEVLSIRSFSVCKAKQQQYVDCHTLFIFMMNGIMQNVVMLIVVAPMG